MVQTVDERINNLIDRLEKQHLKTLDDLEFKINSSHGKLQKAIDDSRDKIIDTIRVARKIRCNLDKDINKNATNATKFPQVKVTKIDPKTFLPEFMRSGRFDFINHFLEAKWGSKYRGDRFKNVWQWEDYRYVPTPFEPLVDEMFTFEDEKILVTCDGPGGRAFFDNNMAWFSLGEVYFTRENLRKFLIYMHNKLPKLRTR